MPSGEMPKFRPMSATTVPWTSPGALPLVMARSYDPATLSAAVALARFRQWTLPDF